MIDTKVVLFFLILFAVILLPPMVVGALAAWIVSRVSDAPKLVYMFVFLSGAALTYVFWKPIAFWILAEVFRGF
jgi:hypothetical protein